METTRPQKHVQIPESQIGFASLYLAWSFPLTFYLKLLSISDLIVADFSFIYGI